MFRSGSVMAIPVAKLALLFSYVDCAKVLVFVVGSLGEMLGLAAKPQSPSNLGNIHGISDDIFG